MPRKKAARRPDEHSNRTDQKQAHSRHSNADRNKTGSPDLDPYEIDFLPEFQQGRGPRDPFVNDYGVVIGDHEYDSSQSPLNQWSKETDPTVMAGDEWIHPYKDIGFQTDENRDYFEKGIAPDTGKRFMHPVKDAAVQVQYTREHRE